MYSRLLKTVCLTCTKVPQKQQLQRLSKSSKDFCVIKCKRSIFDHYLDTTYNNLEEVPLASKGWTHSKANGDFFNVNPIPGEIEEGSVSFREMGVNSEIIKALESRGINKATSYQAKAMPLVTGNKHLLLAAETGCGKTVSYLVPIIQSIMESKSQDLNSPRAIVIVPNRELAYQVAEIAQILAERVDVKVKVVVGGRTKRLMTNPEFADIDLLVGTPGALGKLSSVGIYRLNQVQYTVLDEADTLVDDSFVDRMGGIIRRVPQSKIILVSATMPAKLPDILKPIEENYAQLVSPKLHRPLLNISQKFLRMTRSAKPSSLLQLAKTNKHPMLIFTNKNDTCNWLAMFLRENKVPCSNINGNMNYAIRIEQWNDFISGKTNILSATDVGSRGLDTTQVRHVLNYDFPLYAADYLHRVGRVGRLGSSATSKVTNFVSGNVEIKLVQQIELAIRKNQALVNVDGNITNLVQNEITRNIRQAA